VPRKRRTVRVRKFCGRGLVTANSAYVAVGSNLQLVFQIHELEESRSTTRVSVVEAVDVDRFFLQGNDFEHDVQRRSVVVLKQAARTASVGSWVVSVTNRRVVQRCGAPSMVGVHRRKGKRIGSV